MTHDVFKYVPGTSDERGNLRWIEGGITIPFEIKRVFYITQHTITTQRI